MAIDNPAKPRALKVRLKHSKCDQMGKGVDVFIGSSGNDICPVAAVLSYIISRGNKEGPFFMLPDRQPLTKSYFVAKVRLVLQAVGLPQQHFAGHSFRIGAATAAAKAGIEDSVICSLGRWNSSAFLSYIRTPRENLTKYTCVIGSQ